MAIRLGRLVVCGLLFRLMVGFGPRYVSIHAIGLDEQTGAVCCGFLRQNSAVIKQPNLYHNHLLVWRRRFVLDHSTVIAGPTRPNEAKVIHQPPHRVNKRPRKTNLLSFLAIRLSGVHHVDERLDFRTEFRSLATNVSRFCLSFSRRLVWKRLSNWKTAFENLSFAHLTSEQPDPHHHHNKQTNK
ncbi:unnamed protein product [Protopolystoma xenopodis]|uniref:Secreted protein n=1 Tax=Protopolystoma xenopodis TaxID=117903 RepID=A0A3S5AQ74_9PLAT|nr:unnamed protein product [Protopolystoma xenopodis]